MKIISFLFVLLSGFAFGQEYSIDLDANGKTLYDINYRDSTMVYLAKNERLLYTAKGKNSTIKTINLLTGKTLTEYNHDKGIFLIDSNRNGDYIITHEHVEYRGIFDGDIKKYRYINQGKFSREFEMSDGELLQRAVDQVFLLNNGNYVEIGYRKKKPKQWLIFMQNFENNKNWTIPFKPNGIEDEFERHAFTFLDATEDKFYLFSKKFLNTNGKKGNDVQDLFVSSYDYQGNFIEETKLTIMIDDPNYYFGFAGLKDGYFTKWVAPVVRKNGISSGSSVRIPRWPGMGTVNIDHQNKFYYVISILAGREKKYGLKFHLSKFDFSGDKIWSINQPIVKRFKDRVKLKYINIEPQLTKDYVYFFIEDKFVRVHAATGKIDLDQNEFSDLDIVPNKYDRKAETKRLVDPKDKRKKWVLHGNAIIAYRYSSAFRDYVATLNPKDKILFTSKILNDGTFVVLQTTGIKKNKQYRLLRFKAE